MGCGVGDLWPGIWGFSCVVLGLGCGARGVGLGVWSWGCVVWGVGYGVWGFGFGVRVSGGGVWGLDFGVGGSALTLERVWGCDREDAEVEAGAQRHSVSVNQSILDSRSRVEFPLEVDLCLYLNVVASLKYYSISTERLGVGHFCR